MATIMTWGNSEGTKGRCDAKCHEAAGPICECMCVGRFHGAALRPGGIDKAVKDYWDKVWDQAQEKARAEGMDIVGQPLQARLI